MYRALGFCVIPVRPRTKKAALSSWTEYQDRLPTDEELKRWFGGRNEIAIVCGSVSGGLVVVDFDDPDYYQRWRAAHPVLAERLPTAQTPRPGYHVYFRSDWRKSHKLRDGDHDYGEVRAEGNYVLASPSRHPSGAAYEWLIEPDGDLPYLTLEEFDLDAALPAPQRKNTEDTEDTEDPDESEAIGGGGGLRREPGDPTPKAPGEDSESHVPGPTPVPGGGAPDAPPPHRWLPSSSVSGDLAVRIEFAIQDSLPRRHGERNDQVFDLCRALKAIPELTHRPFPELVPIVKEWFRRAMPSIHTKDFETTLEDFAHGWPRVQVPKEADFMENIVVRAKKAPVPECVAELGMPKLSLLARICVELQRSVGDRPFFLSCRKAGELLDIPHARANKLLHVLIDIGFMEIAEQATARQAPRYRLLDASARGESPQQH